MFERILVPLDGSKAAERVLPYVREIAAKGGSHIVLTRVTEPGGTVSDSRSYLDSVAAGLKLESVEPKVLMGNPAYEILNCAGETECDLIVIASRGASNEPTWPLGNIAAKILRVSPIPVLLIRNEILPGQKDAGLFKRIMVPLDGSRLSEVAIELGKEMARKTGAEIVLFRAIEPNMILPNPALITAHGISTDYASVVFTGVARPVVNEYLKGIKNALVKDGLNVSAEIREGYPAGEIIDFAEANSIDLIVMSTHGLTGIGRWVFGSVTDKVLHAGNKPVMVIRSKNI